MNPPDWTKREGLALLTDLYELTMMAGYWKSGRHEQRVQFEYFFRNLPPHAGFAVTAGLGPFLDYLEALHFTEEDLAYLRGLNIFDEGFLDYLKDFRPRLNIKAMPEGTLAYPFEPILLVEGPILDAQLVETALLNILNYQTLIATKASRICLAAMGDPVIEFGLRRAHGPDGGLSGSRAAYIGGCTSTSNVLAGKVYGLPVSGTHAHSWVMSYGDELEAFRAFAEYYPKRCVFLVDTYDTLRSGVPNAIRAIQEMHAAGIPVRPAIRLDSGDLAKLSKAAYKLIIDAGLKDPLIVASNDLDEDLIADLKRQGAKINAWGVGTQLITAHDSPALNGVYKLTAIEENGAWAPRIKVSSNPEKGTDPGPKELVRYYDEAGAPLGDVMYQVAEQWPNNGVIHGRVRAHPHREVHFDAAASAATLLVEQLREGERVSPHETAETARARAQAAIAALPDEFKRLRNPEIYRVFLSKELGETKDRLYTELG